LPSVWRTIPLREKREKKEKEKTLFHPEGIHGTLSALLGIPYHVKGKRGKRKGKNRPTRTRSLVIAGCGKRKKRGKWRHSTVWYKLL